MDEEASSRTKSDHPLGRVDSAAAASVATAGEGEVDGVDMVAVLEWLVGTAALSTNFFSFLAAGTNCSR